MTERFCSHGYNIDLCHHARVHDGRSFEYQGKNYCVFDSNLDLNGLQIKNVNFQDATFLENVNFNDSHFQNKTNFVSAIFHEDASFIKCHFKEAVHFSGCIYYKKLDFTGVNFHKTLEILGLNKTKQKNFSNASLIFDNAQSTDQVDFCNAHIYGKLSLKNSKFNSCNFSQAHFYLNKYNGFSEWEIPRNTTFNDAEFHCQIDFSSKTHVINTCNFDRAKFYDDVSFQNREFAEKCRFNDTVFVKAPDFTGSKIHKGINLRHAIFKDKVREAYDDYIALKNIMQDIGKKEDYLHFFKLAQECKYKNEKWYQTNPVNWWYRSASDYGTNYIRPLGLLGALIFIFWMMNTAIGFYIHETSRCCPMTMFSSALNFTLSETFYPLHVWRFSGVHAPQDYGQNFLHLFEQPTGLLLFKIYVGLTSIINISLIAFIFLGLNWHFKKKMD